jgi:hypothetical protein
LTFAIRDKTKQECQTEGKMHRKFQAIQSNLREKKSVERCASAPGTAAELEASDVVQSGGVVAFFEPQMNFTAQVSEEISDRLGRGLDHRASYEFAVRIEDGNGDG